MDNTQIPKIVFCALVCASIVSGSTLLDFKQMEPAETDTSVYTFSFELTGNGNRLIMNADSDLEYGTLNIWIGGGGYDVIGNYTNQGTFTYRNIVFGPLNNSEPIEVIITATQANGAWHVVLTEFSTDRTVPGLIVSAIIILIISSSVIVWWKQAYRESMKWIWIGGGIWAVGVILKFGFAFLANETVLGFLQAFIGQGAYLGIGSFYIGLLTGVFEIGITLAYALSVRSSYKNPCVAMGIGLGAGTVEAFLIGFSQIGNAFFLLSEAPGSSDVIASLAQTVSMNHVFFLLAPIERAITIACHVGSRALTLYALARRKYVYFWAGFLLMTGIDSIAGYAHLSGLLTTISTWWIELAILPFGIIGLFVTRWCVKNWPRVNTPSLE